MHLLKIFINGVAYVLGEIINRGRLTYIIAPVRPGSCWLGWPAATNPRWLDSQPSRRPGFQHKWCPYQHIPMECFRFQQSNIFLWKSLPSEKSLLALGQAASMPGALRNNEVSYWLCHQRKTSSSLALSGNRVPLVIKNQIPGKGWV